MELYTIIEGLSIPDDNLTILDEPMALISPCENAPCSTGCINANNIVGVARDFPEIYNWQDILINHFHKTHWFGIDSDEYKNIIQDSHTTTLPMVAYCGNKYYIENDGFHRLLIAKLHNIDNIPVIIKDYDNLPNE